MLSHEGTRADVEALSTVSYTVQIYRVYSCARDCRTGFDGVESGLWVGNVTGLLNIRILLCAYRVAVHDGT